MHAPVSDAAVIYVHRRCPSPCLPACLPADRGWQDMDLVMLQPEPPTPSMRVSAAVSATITASLHWVTSNYIVNAISACG